MAALGSKQPFGAVLANDRFADEAVAWMRHVPPHL